jgi:hypothetical protein
VPKTALDGPARTLGLFLARLCRAQFMLGTALELGVLAPQTLLHLPVCVRAMMR